MLNNILRHLTTSLDLREKLVVIMQSILLDPPSITSPVITSRLTSVHLMLQKRSIVSTISLC